MARIDIPRFSAVNTSKGRWALLDQLATTAVATPSSTPEGAPEVAAPRAGMALAAIEKIVKEVAMTIIGDSLEGDLRMI